jgi:hypothetical protein
MRNDVGMTQFAAIDATQLITKEAGAVWQRMYTNIAEHANNIFLCYLGTFITNTMILCKHVFLNLVLGTFLVGGP